MIRLIDLPSDAGQGLGAFDVIPSGFAGPKALSDGLKAAVNATYGTAGPALIDIIAQDPAAPSAP